MVLFNLDFWSLNGVISFSFNSSVILLLYVDSIVFGKTDSHITKVISLLGKHLDLKTLGKTKKLLGVEFEEMASSNCNSVSINQIAYISTFCKI